MWCLKIDTQLEGAVIGAGATLLAALVGFGAIFMQIGRQARDAIKQNRDNEVIKLKLRIYEQILTICETASNREIAFVGYVRDFISELDIAKMRSDQGLPSSLPNSRVPGLLKVQEASTSAAIEIVTATEQWQIIDPRMEVFRLAIIAASHDIRGAFFTDFFPIAMQTMPIDQPNGGPLPPWTVRLSKSFKMSRRRERV
ncbi:MAG: hypothetical protein WDM92_13780 [Caulobacteraceae bacterium]